MIRRLGIVVFSLSLLAPLACSSSNSWSSGDASTDATPDTSGQGDASVGDASTDATDAGGACNAVANDASDVAEEDVVAATPTATGGTITDGTYYLTKWQFYSTSPVAADGGTLLKTRRVWQVSGSRTDVVRRDYPDTTDHHFSFTFTTSGTTHTPTLVCSDPTLSGGPPGPSHFSVNGNDLVIVLTGINQDQVLTFTKQ
jgi:hypothetical protein